MFGKIIGAVIGAKAAKHTRGGFEGPSGAMLGAGAVAVARRFGIPGLLAAAVGGYALKRYNVKREARLSAKVPKVRSSAT